MEASLILLQELFCWTLQDVTFLNQNQRKENEKNKMTPETRFVIILFLFNLYKYLITKTHNPNHLTISFVLLILDHL